jgi:LmbE family N-acetylglucosaminyl deacetylase
MKKNKSTRKDFIKMTSLGLGGLSLQQVIAASKQINSENDKINNKAKNLNIVCIGAHPGDPEFGCGGTMFKYTNAGHTVTFLYLTRGEAGDPSKSYAESAELRTKEAEAACRILKANPMFIGQIDGNTIFSKDKNEQMSKLISLINPDIVFSHWPLDSHPDHQVCGQLTLTAWIKLGKKFELYFYEVNTGSETMWFKPTNYVDITEVRERKKEAMFAHKTQFPEEVYNSYFRTMEEFRGLEAGVKAAEGFIQFTGGSKHFEIENL